MCSAHRRCIWHRASRREVEEDADKERKLAIFGASYRAIARENASFYYRDIVAGSVGLFLLPQVFARFIFGLALAGETGLDMRPSSGRFCAGYRGRLL